MQPAEGELAAADWCCSLDADVPKLLGVPERREYSRRSLQAAVAKGRGLVPCPQPDCPGIAVPGAFIVFSPSCVVGLIRL